ncbi:MAG: Mut7-C RNAse domain-containing protein [Anaerolineales bacterium]|nr:Mut7-C ubiquitin/RNAse domain-containing protein [Anaerolineales bacterium]MCS7248267.1 Mut7-C ubiquitin/RNAse domain-containing protein [Anaerolineales bacterium]MDW8162081.1 Mut7-C RNAse domain-containing protein [Anaerolineales bacterium]MDW8446229.1 Mut7-C RNAse domain-containing protein [Anaerolineales bacterium]
MSEAQKSATFLFHGELNDFLTPSRRNRPVRCLFRGRQTAKHLIESLGVPHPEVGSLRLGEKTLSLDTLVEDGDWIEVHPPPLPLPLPHLSLAASEEPIRFVLDNHLGRLAAYLRLFGFDALYRNDLQDDELAQISYTEERVLLTRDHRLLMRACVQQGYWLRSKLPRQQLVEVLRRWNLVPQVRPFRRCLRCNGLLQEVPKEQILSRLQPLTRLYYDDFRLCAGCGQIYWRGSHYERMQSWMGRVLQAAVITP